MGSAVSPVSSVPGCHPVDEMLIGCYSNAAGWSSLVARWAHNPKVEGSNPSPATNPFHEAPAFHATPWSAAQLANRVQESDQRTTCGFVLPRRVP